MHCDTVSPCRFRCALPQRVELFSSAVVGGKRRPAESKILGGGAVFENHLEARATKFPPAPENHSVESREMFVKLRWIVGSILARNLVRLLIRM